MTLFDTIDIGAATEIWSKMTAFILNLAVLFVIIIIGWIIAVIVARIVREILQALRVDNILSAGGVKERIEGAGMKLSLVKIGEEAAKWIIVLLTLVIAANSVGLNQVSSFLTNILNYIPNIIIAIIILSIGLLLADFVERIIIGGLKTASFGSPEIFGEIARWAVIIFALLIALDQLGLQLEFIKILFTGMVAMIAIAGGIAFGLGGQGMAKTFLEKAKGKMKE